MPRAAMILLMVVMPGGLLVVSGWALARLLAERLRELEGTQPRRLARAVATVRLKDVVRQARRLGQ